MTDLEIVRNMFDMDGIDAFDTVIEEGDWTQDAKMQFSEDIVEYEGQYYMISQSRSGSPFTDWHYEEPEITKVTRSEKIIVKIIWTPQ